MKKITDAKELEQKLKEILLDKEITLVTEEQELYRETQSRMNDEDEAEEDEDQIEVRQILRDIKPGDLLTLDLDNEQSQIPSLAQDKRQRKIREATDKEGSKKKFSTLIKVGKSAVPSVGKHVGISYKEYQQRLKLKEEEKKREEERKKASQDRLTTMFAGYGSSSSSDEESPKTEPQFLLPKPPKKLPKNKTVTQPKHEAENETKVEPESEEESQVVEQAEEDVEGEEDDHDQTEPTLPQNFFDEPKKEPKEEPKEEEEVETGPKKKRKASASFGTDDFWSSVTKKKT